MDPFVGEIRAFAFGIVPQGWAQCNGQLLAISSNTALFSLLGTSYGGDGKSNFALPNLQGNVAVNMGQLLGGNDYITGETAGAASAALTLAQTPTHGHNVTANSQPGTSSHPTGNVFAEGTYHTTPESLYDSNDTHTLSGSALVPYGSNQSHNNLQPFLVVNYCIALQGVFPPRQ